MAKQENQLNKLLYEFNVANGLNLVNFDKPEAIIEQGYNSNPDVYAICNYLTNLYVSIPKKPYRELSDGKLEEITDKDIVDLVNKANENDTLIQFESLRYLFYLASGNSFVYAPKYKAGNNQGQLMNIGRIVMPSQYTEIISGGWREPVKGYIINYNFTEEHLPKEDVIHIKMPNLSFKDGQNFYGMSPIKAAAMIILAQNGGYESMASTLKRGFPSGILSKENEQDTDSGEVMKRLNIFKSIWKRYYGKSKNSNEPIITAGKTSWTPMGFTSYKDLQVIETSQHGLRVLCNCYGIPSQVMNDIAGTTFNNQKETRKAVYNNRIIPDCNKFDEIDNINIWSNYGFKVYSDLSGIPELQQDKKEQIEVIRTAQESGALFSAEEIRKAIDFDTPEDEVLKIRFTNMGKTPVSQVLDPNIDQTLKKIGIEHYIK